MPSSEETLVKSGIKVVNLLTEDAISGLISVELTKAGDILLRELRASRERIKLAQINIAIAAMRKE
jgi:hypothetical protein